MRSGDGRAGEYAVGEPEPEDAWLRLEEREELAKRCASHLADLKRWELYPDPLDNPDCDRLPAFRGLPSRTRSYFGSPSAMCADLAEQAASRI